MTDILVPHTVRDDCDASPVRRGRRPVRLVVSDGDRVWCRWTLRR
jgi:hypothetical protein